MIFLSYFVLRFTETLNSDYRFGKSFDNAIVFFTVDGLTSPTCPLEGTMQPRCACRADQRQFLWSGVADSYHQRRLVDVQSC